MSPMRVTQEEVRYTNNKMAFIKEARDWGKRTENKLTKEDCEFMYKDIQSSKKPVAFDFQESYDKIY